jgi:hypothetical protein
MVLMTKECKFYNWEKVLFKKKKTIRFLHIFLFERVIFALLDLDSLSQSGHGSSGAKSLGIHNTGFNRVPRL